MRDFMITYISLWGISAVGSAPHWQCGGQGFESPMLHQKIPGLEPWYFFASQGFEPLTSCSKSLIWEKQSGGLFRSRLLRFVPFARKSVAETWIRTPGVCSKSLIGRNSPVDCFVADCITFEPFARKSIAEGDSAPLISASVLPKVIYKK